jgi:hypothetical protein
MPPLNWQTEPTELIGPFEDRHKNPAAGALFAWAAWAVECLHYLDDLDCAFDDTQSTIAGHRPDVVDVSHARWATGTCVTALDLCAAGLGRAFCGHTGEREFDLGDFDLARRSSKACRAKLPSPAQQWLDDVFADPDYEVIKSARDWLTHRRVKRHFTLVAGGPPQRLVLELSTGKLPVRQLIELAKELATRHVTDSLRILGQL